MAGEIIAFGVAGFATYLIHKKSKYKHQGNENYFVATGSSGCPCGGKPPKHQNNEEEHPHGIYEDAGYHHRNAHGKKSACPNDGQKCLDQSLPIKNNAFQRVAIEGDQFVIFKQTSIGKFHGYYMTWKEIVSGGNHFTEAVKRTLLDRGLVSRSGKIIKIMIK